MNQRSQSTPHVWRLDITYPEQARDPEWVPEAWEPRDPHDVFRWPPNKMCLSRKTAVRRQRLFESYGCYVTIHRSLPVRWPYSPHETSEAMDTERQLEVMRRRIAELDAERLKLATALHWQEIRHDREKREIRRASR